jgi:hypothetical protein
MWCWWCYLSSVRGVCCLRCEFGVKCDDVVCCATLCCVAVCCTLGGETVCCTLGAALFPTVSAGGITTLDFHRVAPSKISAKRFNANVCSSPKLQNGPAGCGCNRAWVSSGAALVAKSCVEGNGNLKVSGKKSTVYITRSPLVLFMYTV